MSYTKRKGNRNLARLSLSLFAALAALAVFAPVSAAAGDVKPATAIDITERANQALGLIASEVVSLDVAAGAPAPMAITVPIGGVDYTLDLWEHSVRAPDYHVLAQGDDGSYTEVEPQPVCTLRGTVLEAPGSVVAASLLEDGLYARIFFDDEQEYWVEPLAKHLAEATPAQYVVYHRDDIIPNGGSCGADLLNHPPIDDGGGFGERAACGSGVFCAAEMAVDADYQYYQDWGSVAAVENRVNTVINTVNAQYERDVDITHVVTTIIVRTSSGANPYTTNDPSALLDQFRNYWLSNHGGVSRDLAELFTGRNLTGSTIGIAWLGGVCNSFGYSVVESDCCGSLSCSADLSAHEMGHNWSANHCSCSSYTMNAGLTCSNRFHPTSTIPGIVSYRTSHQSCLDAGTVCDVTFSSQPAASSTVCEGGVASISVAVANPSFMDYQWRKGGVDLSNDGHYVGVTTDTLSIVDFGVADVASDYRCAVTNTLESCSRVSSLAELVLDTNLPAITQQPANQVVTEGGFALFSIALETTFFLDYQWYKGAAALTNDGHYFGVDGDALTIVPVALGDAGDYHCVITSQLGDLCSKASDSASLTVNPAGNNCPEDLTGDGSVGLEDLSLLLSNYGITSGAQPEDGDIDGDGDVDLGDLSLLLAAYGLDCPTQ